VYNEETITSKTNASNPAVGDPCHTLGATGAARAICIQGNCIDRADTAGCNGKGWRDDDVSFTLNTIDRPAVYDCRGNGDGETVPTLTGDHQNRVTDYTAVCMTQQAIGEYKESEIGSALKQRDYKDAADLVCAVDCRNGTENPETNGTLQAKSNGGMSLNLQNTVRVASLVRRLTPLECERLQGYPDGWTDLGEWTDSRGKVHQTSDSARYKALGNSIALPPWRFVLSRVNAYLTEHTMASLFDGIGGFQLIWQELNGPGKCLWASEIEEFPIAVTRRRFEE
jgi:DNA (cytosine-5)-methyltransferase 1